jgi:murein DD-endopeptidase MepM/ murein hydrolase activator NlpD
MSFVMFAAGSASGSRVRTVSGRALLLGSGLVALGLLASGVGLGYWISVQPALAAQERPRAALPFAVEQLGALSGRLFKLESQAGQLSERIGVMQGAAPKPALQPSAKPAGSGGPWLPPRLEQEALDDLGALEARLTDIEQRIALVADAATLRNLALMRLPSRLPIESAELGSTFGNRDDPFTGRRAFHAGLDFAAAHGTEIHAAAGGTVAVAGFKPDFGWVVEIEHGNGLSTRYAHASRLLVKAGAIVAPGELIAAVGSSGRSTGPHLHFEVLRHGEATDPRRYLAGL